MQVWWRAAADAEWERLGDYQHGTSLSFDEMDEVKKQLGKEYQHPSLFIDGALTIVEKLDVERDENDEPILVDGNPVLKVVPNSDWNPAAFRQFVVLMGNRVGKGWYYEDLGKMYLSDVRIVRDALETAEAEEAAAEEAEGKDGPANEPA